MAGKTFLSVRLDKIGLEWMENDEKVQDMILTDRPAFDEIGKRLLAATQAQYTAAFSNTPATALRKGQGPIQRTGKGGSYHGVTGGSATPGMSSGQTLQHMSEAASARWAGVWRGEMEWYTFLHNAGAGYAYWSVNPRPNRKANPATRASHRTAERTTAGTTMFREMPYMFIDSGTEKWIVDRVQTAIQTHLDKGGAGASS